MSDLNMDWDSNRGLPRSLADDPFFQYHHQRNSPSAEYFRDFPPPHSNGGPTRRFGSNPRLYDNVGPEHYFSGSDFDPNNFNSLPRRQGSRSPRPPSERPPSAMAGERQVPVMHQQNRQSVPIPMPPPSPQPPRKQHSDPEPQQKQPPAVHVYNVHPAVEINNSPPSSYTNGKLNPDRAAADNVSTKSEDNNSESSLEHTRETSTPSSNQESAGSQSLQSSMDGKSNGTPTQNGKTKRASFERKTSIDACGDKLIQLLDDAEARVEHLRDAAAKLEIEKEQILDILGNLKLNSEMLRLGEGERDDINATTDRILKRCKAVDVVVNTPRSEEQSRALDEVNTLIEAVIQKMQDDLNSSKDTVQRFLNACSPDEPDGAIDQRFQAKVVECTADDQKKIRRRLAQIITQIDRAERTCVPNF